MAICRVGMSDAELQAQQRARELLLEYLSPHQRETFRISGHFDVDRTAAPRPASLVLRLYPRFRVYRLSEGRVPVALFTSPARLARCAPKYAYCIHANGHVPKCDELLSLKLLLEHDEARFVRVAYRFSAARIELHQPEIAWWGPNAGEPVITPTGPGTERRAGGRDAWL